MLTIRNSKQATFAAASREVFLQRMECHVCKHFQPVAESLTKQQLREVIERNWTRAEEYGLKSELGVCSYLNVVFTLGEEFEKQRAYSWAVPLLGNAEMKEERKINALGTRVEAELQQAMKREER